jgi:hypothetical protein
VAPALWHEATAGSVLAKSTLVTWGKKERLVPRRDGRNAEQLRFLGFHRFHGAAQKHGAAVSTG